MTDSSSLRLNGKYYRLVYFDEYASTLPFVSVEHRRPQGRKPNTDGQALRKRKIFFRRKKLYETNACTPGSSVGGGEWVVALSIIAQTVRLTFGVNIF